MHDNIIILLKEAIITWVYVGMQVQGYKYLKANAGSYVKGSKWTILA